MQWSVKLADNFTNTISGIIGILLLIMVIITIIVMVIVSLVKRQKRKVPIQPVEIIDVSRIKIEYMGKLDVLLLKVQEKKITDRKAYNVLSVIIREFVFKVTKIDVLKYTLSEIKGTNKKELVELLNEYYEPEFSKEGKGNIEESISKTRKVIFEWK